MTLNWGLTARRFENRRRQPRQIAIVGNDDVGRQERRVVLGVGTASKKKKPTMPSERKGTHSTI